MFCPHISWLVLAGPDRKQQTGDQRLHIDRRHKSEQELPCNMRGKSSVHTVEILPLWLHKFGVQPKQGRETEPYWGASGTFEAPCGCGSSGVWRENR